MAVRSHSSSVVQILMIPQYSDRYHTVVSADEQGFVEYWTPTEPFELPKNVPRLWSYKTETDLYDFKKVPLKSTPFLADGKLTQPDSTVEIRTNLYHPVSRLGFLRDLLPSRSADPHLQLPVRKDLQEIRRIPNDNSRDAASRYSHLQSGRHGIRSTVSG